MLSLLLSGEKFEGLWAPDWSQFWPSIIATLVGFLLAIVFQQIVYDIIAGGIKNQIKAREQLKKIEDELRRIVYEEIVSFDTRRAYIDPIKTPVWDAVIYTNELQCITEFLEKYDKRKRRHAKKETGDLRKRLFRVYGLISEYNKWCNLYSEQRVSGRGRDELSRSDLNRVQQRLQEIKTSIVSEDLTQEESGGALLKCLEEILNRKRGNGEMTNEEEWN